MSELFWFAVKFIGFLALLIAADTFFYSQSDPKLRNSHIGYHLIGGGFVAFWKTLKMWRTLNPGENDEQ